MRSLCRDICNELTYQKNEINDEEDSQHDHSNYHHVNPIFKYNYSMILETNPDLTTQCIFIPTDCNR